MTASKRIQYPAKLFLPKERTLGVKLRAHGRYDAAFQNVAEPAVDLNGRKRRRISQLSS
jgi:hypothetical protein